MKKEIKRVANNLSFGFGILTMCLALFLYWVKPELTNKDLGLLILDWCGGIGLITITFITRD